MTSAEPVRRTSEIEEITNLYLIHPIASWLTPLFAGLHIHPNAVSIAGMAFGVSAGVAYAQYQDVRYAIAGFLLMIAWHVMDGADGQLARLTKTQSELGKVLDGICDYVTFIAVYAGLAVALGRQHGEWVWPVVTAAGACHAVQAAAYELQRQTYNFWGWARTSAAPPGLTAPPQNTTRGLANRLHQLYAEMQTLTAGDAMAFHKRLAALLERQPERGADIRSRYRAVFAPVVRRWSVMSSNYRTVGLFVGALLKAPLAYFLFEIVVLTLILVLLLSQQGRLQTQFLKSLETAAE